MSALIAVILLALATAVLLALALGAALFGSLVEKLDAKPGHDGTQSFSYGSE